MSKKVKTCENCDLFDVHNFGDRDCPFVSFNGLSGRYVQVLPIGNKWDIKKDNCTKWKKLEDTKKKGEVIVNSFKTEIVASKTTKMRNTDVVVGAVIQRAK